LRHATHLAILPNRPSIAPTNDARRLRIVFVHTPMATLRVEERKTFWKNFDLRYHAAHPGLRHMRKNLWELPHWMTWLAGVLLQAGHDDLGTLDFYTAECALSGVDQSRVLQTLRENPADVYLFSPMTPNLPFAYEIAELIKTLYPTSRTIFGGVVATPLAEEVAANRHVDYVVFDRGEYALPKLLSAIAGGEEPRELARISNLCFRSGATHEVFKSPEKYPSIPLEELPFPKVDLFPADTGEDLRYLRQVYALGCPYLCSFCTIQTIGRKAAYFAIDRVIKEIRAYRDHYGKHHNIYFGDETFTLHPARTVAICDALKDEGNIQYDCQTRLNCMTDATVLRALRESGCRWVEIGLETFDQDSQNLYKQKVKLDALTDDLRRIRDEGLPACSFLVNGFPNQTTDDMRRSVDFACELLQNGLLQATYLFGLVPYPGSEMFQHPERHGLTIHHRNFKLYHEDMPPVYSTPNAGPDDMYEAFLYGVAALGQAMGTRPHFGDFPAMTSHDEFGTFWQDPHV
jgi:anaerobic magnesium-protoporphyrin IX monomethyl ester cyclase